MFGTPVETPCVEEADEHVIRWQPEMTANYLKLKIKKDRNVSGVLCPNPDDKKQGPMIRLSDLTLWIFVRSGNVPYLVRLSKSEDPAIKQAHKQFGLRMKLFGLAIDVQSAIRSALCQNRQTTIERDSYLRHLRHVAQQHYQKFRNSVERPDLFLLYPLLPDGWSLPREDRTQHAGPTLMQ